MSFSLIAIPLLLIAIMYLYCFRSTPSEKKTINLKKRPAEVVRASLEERVRRRMGKSS